MSKQILIIEDESAIATLLRDYFQKEGFQATIYSEGDKAVSMVKTISPDAIILDIMLPGKSGIDICREIRTFSAVPVLMLSARVEEIDRLIGLELGADDYICKPFSPREVVARVKAVLRRSQGDMGTTPLQVLECGPVRLDVDAIRAFIYGNEITLTRSEFELLHVLAGAPMRVFSRSDLITRVHGYTFEGYERTIDSHIKNIRKKMAEFSREEDLIQTVYGVGYRMACGK